jgi:hypothetical protein
VPRRGLGVVGDEQARYTAFVADVAQQPQDLAGTSGVEVAGGLIGEEQVRLAHERTSDGHTLALAHRELVGTAVEPIAETEALRHRSARVRSRACAPV